MKLFCILGEAGFCRITRLMAMIYCFVIWLHEITLFKTKNSQLHYIQGHYIHKGDSDHYQTIPTLKPSMKKGRLLLFHPEFANSYLNF